MFATLISVALFAAASIQGALADLTIDTPSINQCQDVRITWSSTAAPYNLIVVDAADPCSDALVDLGDHNGLSMTWKPTLPTGTQVMLSLVDANDEEAWSGAITIGDSSDSSCVPASLLAAVSSSAAAAASSAAAAVASVSSVAVVDTTSATTLVVPASASAASSTASASTSIVGPVGAVGNNGPLGDSSSNGAMRQATTPLAMLCAIAAVFAFSL